MSLVFLVRHAHNDYIREGRLAGRSAGIHINQKGIEQTKQLIASLKKIPIKAIYSSPLERAIDTAQLIADEIKLDIVQEEALLEIDYGEWQGKKLVELRKTALWRSVVQTPALIRFPGGESFFEAQLRATRFILSIFNQYERQEKIICVTHADIIKLIVAYFLGLSLDHFQKINISTSSVTVLNCHQHRVSLLGLSSPVFFYDT